MKKCSSCGREFATESDYLTYTKRWRVCSMKNLWFNCACGSTLMVPKGKYDWYSPDKGMSEKAASVFNQLSIKELPHIPNAIMEIQQHLEDESISANRLAEEVKKEPLVATEILRIANNLKLNSSEITSIQHAISFIGRKTVKEIVLTAVVKTFAFKTKDFKQTDFWQESYQTATITEVLAKRYNSAINSDEIYLAAYLANIGKIVAAVTLPDKVDQVYRTMTDENAPCTWSEAEQQVGAFNHVIMGEIAAVFWGLPEYILAAATTHHDAPRLDSKKAPRGREIIALAIQVTHMVNQTPSRCDQSLLGLLKKRFDLDDGAFLAIVEEFKHSLAKAS